MELTHYLLNDEWIKEETRKKIKIFLEPNENENSTQLSF